MDAGGLIAYGGNLAEQWRRAATYVDKILKGADPGELPVEQPTAFELVINLRDGEGTGADDFAVAAAKSGRGDSVADHLELIAVEWPVLVRRDGRSGRTAVIFGMSLPLRTSAVHYLIRTRFWVGLQGPATIP